MDLAPPIRFGRSPGIPSAQKMWALRQEASGRTRNEENELAERPK
jgi:hypothetical protein